MTSVCRIAAVALIGFFSALQMANAQDADSTALVQTPVKAEKSGPSLGAGLHLSGFWSMETGQWVDYWMVNSSVPRQNILHTFVNLGVSKQLTDHLLINASLEGKMYFNTFDKTYNAGVESFVLPTMYYNFYIDRAEAIYSFGEDKSPFLQLTLGYFPFKYNPDVRDLGEYLYRSGTYPAYLITEFDFPQARLTGLKVSSDLFDMLHQDLLITTGTERPPFFDLNLGYVASVDIAKILNIGIGGMYQSLISANPNVTSPHQPDNVYLKNAVYDTVKGAYKGDTAYYTFEGLKLMARGSFDPKRIFIPSESDLGIWGKEDLKLYGEIAILGVQDYPKSVLGTNPYGYDSLMQKMPFMLGLNVPTFKILDVFSAEVEWFGSKYPNNYQYKGMSQIIPTPCPQAQGMEPEQYDYLNNWKWAFYAKKSFDMGLFLVAQVALDHVRNETPIASSVDFEESLRTDHSWSWMFKMGYKF